MLKTTQHTNQHENSVTVERETGERIDFCHMENELVIGQTNPDGSHVQIPLPLQEAQILHEKLSTIFRQ